jgi:hypothetical protein
MFDRAATDKNAKTLRGTIFSRFSMGLQPKCDEWIYDKCANDLKDKMLFFTAAFNAAVEKHNFPNEEIKCNCPGWFTAWSARLAVAGLGLLGA